MPYDPAIGVENMPSEPEIVAILQRQFEEAKRQGNMAALNAVIQGAKFYHDKIRNAWPGAGDLLSELIGDMLNEQGAIREMLDNKNAGVSTGGGGGGSQRNGQLRLAMSAPLADRVRSAVGMRTTLDELIGHLEQGRLRAAEDSWSPEDRAMVGQIIESAAPTVRAQMASFGPRADALFNEIMAWIRQEVPFQLRYWSKPTPQAVNQAVTDMVAKFRLGVMMGDPDSADEATSIGSGLIGEAVHEILDALENSDPIWMAKARGANVAEMAGANSNSAWEEASLVVSEDGLWNVIEAKLCQFIARGATLDVAKQQVIASKDSLGVEMYSQIRQSQRDYGLWYDGRYQSIYDIATLATDKAASKLGLSIWDNLGQRAKDGVRWALVNWGIDAMDKAGKDAVASGIDAKAEEMVAAIPRQD
jgi:hypothetical protein